MKPVRIGSLVALSLLAACTAPAPVITPPPPPSGKHTGHVTGRYTDGMVSAADPRAAQIGALILAQGGTATDAAIAVMLALSVVEPQSSGIGGGGFYVHSSFTGAVTTLDGRETAPDAATPNRFLDADGAPLSYPQAVISGLSVGVPGNIALIAQAHAQSGQMNWASLFAPAIALARDGFAITPRLHAALTSAKNRAALTPFGQALFYSADGNPLPVGTLVRNAALAETLEAIAKEGPDAFYKGPLAADMAATIAAATPQDGRMTMGDITRYEAKEREAVCAPYRAYRLCGMGPPSAGATTVYAVLKQLERFDLTALGADSPVAWHLFAESQRLAYADRDRYLADSDFVSVPVTGLMDAAYLAQRSSLLSAQTRMSAVSAGTPEGAVTQQLSAAEQPENGTTHFAVVDKQGNAVSYTSTVEGPFGSGLMAGGFYLNNELTDFTFKPADGNLQVANRVEGGKRPRSSMAPTLVFDARGQLVVAIGAAGGSTIPMQVAKALIGVLDWKLSVQDAIALPGLFSPYDSLTLEPDSPLLRFQSEWEAMGHRVTTRAMPFKANAVEVHQTPNGLVLRGGADPRSEGTFVAESRATAPSSTGQNGLTP